MQIETLWEQYREALQGFLRARVADPDDVDDLLQEILIKSHRNLHTVKAAGAVKSWLYRIAGNAIVDFYRSRGREKGLSAEDLWYQAGGESLQQSLAGCIEPFVRSLPAPQAELLTAIDLNGVSQKAYAEQKGISYSTLKSRVQKSRAALRGQFERCCQLTLDGRGRVMDCDPKSGDCMDC